MLTVGLDGADGGGWKNELRLRQKDTRVCYEVAQVSCYELDR